MQIHGDVVTSTGVGGTSDTFDAVGTVRTRDDAVQLLGAWVSAGPVTAAPVSHCGRSNRTSTNMPGWAGSHAAQ